MSHRGLSRDSDLDPSDAFIEAACVDCRGWHGGGTLEQAESILRRHPDAARANIHAAAVSGDAATVRQCLARDPSLASAPGGPHGWDALTYLAFSRYLRLDRTRSEGFVAATRALLAAGADANTGWIDWIDDPPRAVRESAIYGAAALAQHAGVTSLLLHAGADPNDEETPYHVAEGYDNGVLRILLASGRLNAISLATIALRKADWHDVDGLRLVLDHGADPNARTVWGCTPFQHAIRRDNPLEMIELFLDHGADPSLVNEVDGRNAMQMAAHHGRGDVLVALERRGFDVRLAGLDAFVAAAAHGDLERMRSLAATEAAPAMREREMGGVLLAHFAGVGNVEGVRCLLAFGVPPDARRRDGDRYWTLAADSTALHVAAWRAQHDVVRTLLAAGAPVNARDARDRTPLQLAVAACIESYWKDRRRPDSVAALLAAGAGVDGIAVPTGYAAIDRLLLEVRPA